MVDQTSSLDVVLDNTGPGGRTDSQTTSLDVDLDIREPGGRAGSQKMSLVVVDGLREPTCASTVDRRGVLEEQAVSSYCLSYSIFHS